MARGDLRCFLRVMFRRSLRGPLFLFAALGVRQVPEILGRFREGDIRHCVADITRARRLLGYAPRVGLEDGLRELAEWSRGQRPEDRVGQARAELEAKRLIR